MSAEGCEVEGKATAAFPLSFVVRYFKRLVVVIMRAGLYVL